MDNQPLTPSSSSPFSTIPTGGGAPRKSPIVPIMLILLGFGTVIFGVLTIVFANSAASTAKAADARVQAAAAKATEDQKQADEIATAKANGSPFRAYTAPVAYGSFQIYFPKNWSSYVDEEPSGKQVQLIINPEFIRKTKGVEDLVAARITFEERTKDAFLAGYASYLKNGKLKRTETKVSDQTAYDFTGEFPDKRTVHQVVVPVRDKVLVFSSENTKYAPEFSQILAQAKIVP